MRRHFLLLVLFSYVYDLESFLTQQSNGSILVHQISSVNNSRAQNVGSRGSWLVLRFVPYRAWVHALLAPALDPRPLCWGYCSLVEQKRAIPSLSYWGPYDLQDGGSIIQFVFLPKTHYFMASTNNPIAAQKAGLVATSIHC